LENLVATCFNLNYACRIGGRGAKIRGKREFFPETVGFTGCFSAFQYLNPEYFLLKRRLSPVNIKANSEICPASLFNQHLAAAKMP
jgi:hypothetical protein